MQKFDAYTQAEAYELEISKTIERTGDTPRKFPPYIKGRVLDVQWIPAKAVYAARKIFKNPKL